jgi:hypothetical protein
MRTRAIDATTHVKKVMLATRGAVEQAGTRARNVQAVAIPASEN